ncbi:helix-turn-helix transcriptional regulator [Halosolutus gelatinilyticus]|uniref:helix-turn-helix transcriptional regulator n=1 Tax=Halosolutus gelatinilyticus TaxID=2931975 RepID=UPI001FF648BB|nr:transcriptional regulator FilR1 domain-containing protein [Halosolutus gelatinilyticus]
MDRALEEIEFLARSANRIEVLNAVRDQPRTRRDLQERTGASQPTLGRILQDFADRNWVVRTADGYAATATGRLVAEGITDLRDIVETELELRGVVRWLPTETMTFDLRRLHSATITVPSQTRPSAPVQRVTELVRQADRVRVVSHAFNERTLEVVRERTVEAGGTFEGVFSASAIEPVAEDAVLRKRLRDLVAAENAEIRIADGDVPLAITVTDGVVALLVRDDNGMLQASLETDDGQVRSWAEDLHERYWTEARPLEERELAE